VPIYDQHKANLFKGVEVAMLCDILDPKKRIKATQGNSAYTFDKVHGARMIEEGKLGQVGDLTIILQGTIDKIAANDRQLADLRRGAITVNEDSK
ncbi:hypothetical protein LCGC14_2303050, partial [marine sediment metagenome]